MWGGSRSRATWPRGTAGATARAPRRPPSSRSRRGSGELHHAEGAEQGVGSTARRAAPGRLLGAARQEARPRACRRRHERPARDLGVLAGGGDGLRVPGRLGRSTDRRREGRDMHGSSVTPSATIRRRARPVLDLGRPARVGAARLRAVPGRAAARGRARMDAAGTVRSAAARDAGDRGLPRGGGDRRQGRQRAGARLAARPARGDRGGRRRRRARTDATAARARGGRRRRARAAARRQVPRAGRRGAAASGELLAFSDANSMWEPDALGQLAARSTIRRSATPAARCGSSTTPAPTRRACTGATRCGCASTSRRSRR